MRAKILFASLLLAVCASHASADTVAATSLFTGTITQAPAGNVFGVKVGDTVNGMILYPQNPIFPQNPVFIDNNVKVGLTIGSITYTPVLASGTDSVAFTDKMVTGIDWNYPTDPIRPPLSVSGSQFFTTDCATDAVCGTLDFSNSQVTPTPEPSTIIFLATGILCVLFWAKRRSKAAATPLQSSTISPRGPQVSCLE